MLPLDGPLVAAPEVLPEMWLAVLPKASAPLALAPGSTRGWFDGVTVVAWAPDVVRTDLTSADAAAMLQESFSADEPSLCAALLPYDGCASVARYRGGLVLTPSGWRTWGSMLPGEVPSPAAVLSPPPLGVPLATCISTDMDEAGYRRGVESIRDAVLAGSVYVVNLTRRLTGVPAFDPAVAFAALRERSHADMAAFWQLPDSAIASVSPERFLRLSGDIAEICPIKGTRPRAEGDADTALASELASSEKERAEHVMIVDLERNDLGRVCEPGSILADPLFEIIATPYCHQMVSAVSGRVRRDAGLPELLAATFPCGSVTGAPKIAAMRTIDELERSSRGAYTGSLVVATPGELDSSVLIRTAEYVGGQVSWGTGAGITVESDPAEEWAETILKASPFLGSGGAVRA